MILKIDNIPSSWHTNKIAGVDWFTKFMKRNPTLAIRIPEATSLSRATSFNRTNVSEFFDKYKSVLDKHNFTSSRIWNVDETGITTVQKPKQIVAQRGQKQVGAVTSAERGTHVTLAVAVNAAGNFIPPMFIFPRVRYTQIFLRNGPPDCIGAGNRSGWMQEKEFLIFLDHFIKHVKPTKEEPVLLMLDNHSSHVNIQVVNKAKDNNIVMISFPPHCSHRLQPLDVGVYGPFKNYISRYQTAWMHNNPGKTMTIYDLPGIVKDSLFLALNPSNIMSGFRKSGIWPLNEDIFQEHDFAPSFITDRPNPTSNNDEPIAGTSGMSVENEKDDIASDVSFNFENPEVLKSTPVLDISVTEIINQMTYDDSVTGPSGIQNVKDLTPEKIRPLPKAPPRKSSIRRHTRKSSILTDTPEKNSLEEEFQEREKKKAIALKRKDKGNKKGQWKETGKAKKKRIEKVEKGKRKSFNENDQEKWFCIMCDEAYEDDAPGEEWVQCILCKQWAHVKCVRGNATSFICINCHSDNN